MEVAVGRAGTWRWRKGERASGVLHVVHGNFAIFRWCDPINVLLRQAKARHGFVDQESNAVICDLMGIDLGRWPLFVMMRNQMLSFDQRDNTFR